MKATIEQFIELMDADERLTALATLMKELPPSAVKEIYQNYLNKIAT